MRYKKANFQGSKLNPSKFDKSQIKFYVVLIPLALFMLLPVVYIINHALKPIDEIFRFPPTFIAQRPTLNNFRFIWMLAGGTGVPAMRYLINTLIVAVTTVTFTVVLTSMTAYALSKKKFRAREWIFRERISRHTC